MTSALRVLIADDDQLFRELLRARLADPRIEIVGEAENGADALLLVQALAPDVVVMDVDMPVLDGLAAAERLVDERAGVRVVILSGSPGLFTPSRAAAAGAGYVDKDELPDDFAAHLLSPPA
jgi:DNA-binding NarL/FixJ family response regulator